MTKKILIILSVTLAFISSPTYGQQTESQIMQEYSEKLMELQKDTLKRLMSVEKEVTSQDCPGGKFCRDDCRPFGNPPNQLCKKFCVATGLPAGKCQTNIGCPLPC